MIDEQLGEQRSEVAAAVGEEKVGHLSQPSGK